MKYNKEYRKKKLDQNFKVVVHDSDVLSWMLRDNVDEFKGRPIEEIKSCLTLGEDRTTVIGRETEFPSSDIGSIVADSIFDVKIPGTDETVSVIVNIEAQGDPNPGYPIGKRAEYYVARMVSSQKGKEFSGSDYGNLRKVYSIWYILDPRQNSQNTVTRYHMMPINVSGREDRQMETLDTFNIVMVNVGSYDDSLPDVIAFPAALFSSMEDEERKNVIKSRFNISLDDNMVGRLRDLSLDEDRENYWRREGKREGRVEGIREGRIEGKREGVREGKISTTVEAILFIAKEMNVSADEILKKYPVPEEFRREVESEVRNRLS